jgi:hypothetical protein
VERVGVRGLAKNFALLHAPGGGGGKELVALAVSAIALLLGRFFVGGDFRVEVFEEPGGGFPGAAGLADDAGEGLKLGLEASGGNVVLQLRLGFECVLNGATAMRSGLRLWTTTSD